MIIATAISRCSLARKETKTMPTEQTRDAKMSIEEFFALRERDPDARYEYIDGYVYMMTGGSLRHSLVCNNIGSILYNKLRDKPCMVFNSDACVKLSETRYVCPDITVSCDQRDRDYQDDDLQKSVQYPTLVVEVLSPGTKARDRGIKFNLYQACPTIQEYLLVETSAPQVQLYRRETNNRWTIYILNLEDSVELNSIGVQFSVAEVYEKTHFVQPQED
jgi:Uma2 family endonuclease